MTHYDAIMVVSFGGPEAPEHVMPFLDNVLRGRNVPRERMLEVAEHYYKFGGVSPINQQNRELIAALRAELDSHKIELPIYWGNRNWEPMIADTLREMQQAGVKRALGLFTSAFSSYSGCRQYRENIEAAREEVGVDAPEVHKLRMYFNHPGFIETMADRVRKSLASIAEERRSDAKLIFTAHSIPMGMSNNCDYVKQLQSSARLIANAVGHPEHVLVYQSRSGPPTQPWLEPDVCDYLTTLADEGETQDVVISPLGFVSDHMEVLFDLDEEAAQICQRRGVNMARVKTAGTHPRYVAMLRELIVERLEDAATRPALGALGPWHDVCPADCCLYERPARPAGRPSA